MAMTPRELIDLLQALVRENRIDPDEELSVALDVGELAVVAEIDFADEQNQLLVCTVWCTTESQFSLCESEGAEE